MKAMILLGLLLLSGCSAVSTSVFPLQSAPYPPSEDVELVAGDVDYPYESLAIIMGARRRWGSREELLAAMKERARQLGATAIINLDTYSRPGMVLSSGVVVNSGGLKGVAIRRLE